MQVYEGDPDVRVERVQSIADGAICNVSRATLGLHTGTHIDAPVHFIDGGAGAEAVALDALIGDCIVVDACEIDSDIDAAALERLGVLDGVVRVLFKTRNSALWAGPTFSLKYIGLLPDAARELVRRGIRLVGIDYLSIAPAGDPAPTHVELLRAGIVILEGLDLRAVTPGPYRIACLPLRLPRADGAPARAVLIRD